MDKPFKQKKEYGSVKRSKPRSSEIVAESGFRLRLRGYFDYCVNKICGKSS